MTEKASDYDLLVRDLLARAAKCGQPIDGTFELTNRCNLFCRMCYVRNYSGDISKQVTELSPDAWLDLARQAKKNGLLFLVLTGGEVFLRSDFFEIYEPLTRMGLLLNVFSNGTLITKEIARRLAQIPPNRTEITLYGATSAVYETITGVTDSFHACCSGIEFLLSYGVPLCLKATLTRQNIHEMEAMRQMAHKWGLSFIPGWTLSKRPDHLSSDVENCRLPAADSVLLEAANPASACEWSETSLKESNEGKDRNFNCFAGRASFTVTPYGEMNCCVVLPAPGARPMESGFEAAWKQLQMYVESSPPPSQICLSCDAKAYCGRCPGWSFTETETLTSPVSYCCDIAQTRKKYYEDGAI
jgi:radical SAM protein with 4Fe4S-binding SPASM domain